VDFDEFPGEDGAPPGRNVIAQIDGTTRAHEIVIIGAHMDSYPLEVRVAHCPPKGMAGLGP
jgi:hypothetical protein